VLLERARPGSGEQGRARHGARAHPAFERGYRAAVVNDSWSAALLLVAAAGCSASSSGSIGAVLGRDNETQALYVRDVPPDLAAAHAGLLPGDEIVMVDGVYVRDLSSKEVRHRLRGDVGSTVELTVIRGRDVLRVRVMRAELRAHDIVKPKEEKIVP
jgi:C-terminal processing protease CtpA/Prc